MPGRFSNLEFDDKRRSESDEGTRTHHERDAWHHLEQANQAHRDGRFEEALRLYTRCLQEDRKLIRAWVGQVQMLVNLGEFHEARVWSDKALELFRNNGELLATKAQACIRLKDRRTAMASSDGSMQAPGSSPWRWIARGDVLLGAHQSHHDDCFERALAEPSADWFDRVIIARTCAYYGRFAAAIAYLNRALELEPANAYTWCELGCCQAAVGLTGAARQSLDRCLELRPDCDDAIDAINRMSQASFWHWFRAVLRRWSNR